MGIYNNAMSFFNILLTVYLSLDSGNLQLHFFSLQPFQYSKTAIESVEFAFAWRGRLRVQWIPLVLIDSL